MKLLFQNLKALAETFLANLVYTFDTEPVRVYTGGAAAVVFFAAKFGIVVDEQSAKDALAYALPILLAGVGARRKVSPVR
jgi:hypothetical protein